MKPVSSEIRRKQRVRTRIRKTANGRVRLSVHRSGKHIYAQLIDDKQGITLVAASTNEKDVRSKVKNGATLEGAKLVGQLVAKRAQDAKVDHIVFDRGGYIFHGRVKALAEAAREAGLKF